MTRLICDDKGVRFLVGFGMPGRHHEDDESRAVVASVHIQAMLPELPSFDGKAGLVPCIGITTGTVFCGEAGSIKRREYTLAGARVNLAARLMSYAGKRAEAEGLPGAVIVSQEVRDAVTISLERSPELAALCDFLTLPPNKFKGISEPLPIFQAASPQTARGSAAADEGRFIRSMIAARRAASVPGPGGRRKASVGGSLPSSSISARLEASMVQTPPKARKVSIAPGKGGLEAAQPRRNHELVGRAAELEKLNGLLTTVLCAPEADEPTLVSQLSSRTPRRRAESMDGPPHPSPVPTPVGTTPVATPSSTPLSTPRPANPEAVALMMLPSAAPSAAAMMAGAASPAEAPPAPPPTTVSDESVGSSVGSRTVGSTVDSSTIASGALPPLLPLSSLSLVPAAAAATEGGAPPPPSPRAFASLVSHATTSHGTSNGGGASAEPSASSSKHLQQHPIFLVGHTGMGKTELLHSFLRDARQQTPMVLYSAAVAIEATTPFYIWKVIFQRLLSPELIAELAALSALEPDDLSAVSISVSTNAHRRAAMLYGAAAPRTPRDSSESEHATSASAHGPDGRAAAAAADSEPERDGALARHSTSLSMPTRRSSAGRSFSAEESFSRGSAASASASAAASVSAAAAAAAAASGAESQSRSRAGSAAGSAASASDAERSRCAERSVEFSVPSSRGRGLSVPDNYSTRSAASAAAMAARRSDGDGGDRRAADAKGATAFALPPFGIGRAKAAAEGGRKATTLEMFSRAISLRPTPKPAAAAPGGGATLKGGAAFANLVYAASAKNLEPVTAEDGSVSASGGTGTSSHDASGRAPPSQPQHQQSSFFSFNRLVHAAVGASHSALQSAGTASHDSLPAFSADASAAEGSTGGLWAVGEESEQHAPPARPQVSRWQDALYSVLAPRPRGVGFTIRPNRDAELLHDETVRRLAPLLNPLLATSRGESFTYIEDNLHTRGMSHRIREDNQLKVMCRVLEIKLRGIRGVIALEDCQWMDSASWRLLKQCLPLLRGRILMLALTRSSLLDESRSGSHHQHGTHGAAHKSHAVQPDVIELYREARRAGHAMHLTGLDDVHLCAMIANQLDVEAEQARWLLMAPDGS